MKNAIRLTLFVILVFTILLSVCKGQSYELVKTISVSGPGPWGPIAPDTFNGRLFAANGDQIDVFNERGEIVGHIPNLKGIRSISIDSEKHRGIIASQNDSTLAIVDTATLTLLWQVKLSDTPSFSVADNSTGRIFAVAEGQSTIIDRDGNKLGSLRTPNPISGASDQRAHIFIATSEHSVDVYDALTSSLLHEYSLPDCDPRTIVTAQRHPRLYIGCTNGSVIVLDSDTGKRIGKTSVCKGLRATVFNEENNIFAAACGKDGVVLLRERSPGKFQLLQQQKTRGDILGAAFGEGAQTIFLTANDGGAPPPDSAANSKNPSLTLFLLRRHQISASPVLH